MLKRHLLTQYKAKITPAQAAEGIRVAEQNAKDLLADAELPLEHEEWSRACALSILAIEEAGKPPMLRELLLARNVEELRESWRKYRRHVNKNAMWIIARLVAEGARRLEDFHTIFDETSEHTSLLEAVKQIAFYSDSCGDCNWSLPSAVIDQDMAKMIVSIARLLAHGPLGAMSTQAELELWVKHMRPVWKQSNEQMKSALLACYQEAEETGVLSDKHTAHDMAQFMGLE